MTTLSLNADPKEGRRELLGREGIKSFLPILLQLAASCVQPLIPINKSTLLSIRPLLNYFDLKNGKLATIWLLTY